MIIDSTRFFNAPPGQPPPGGYGRQAHIRHPRRVLRCAVCTSPNTFSRTSGLPSDSYEESLIESLNPFSRYDILLIVDSTTRRFSIQR